jgi:phage terminase small subunit
MKITAKQIAFAEGILAGNTGSESYRRAYNTKASSRLVSVKAARLLANPTVAQWLSEMRAKLEKPSILDKQKSLELLTDIATSKKGTTTRDRISAVKQISRMQGFDAPTQIEAKIQGSLLDQIRRGKS